MVQFCMCRVRVSGNLRERGFKQVPEKLNRELPFDQQWTSGKLLFSQACGYYVVLAYKNCLRLVATPVYTVGGCSHGLYSSVIVVRRQKSPNVLRRSSILSPGAS